MYDLRVVVEEVRGFCDLPMVPGDYFEVKGGRIYLPQGKHMCIWALQSLLPMLPLKQREISEQNDWVPHTHRMSCPDPNGMVIFRIDRARLAEPANGQISEVAAASPASDSHERIPARLLVDERICSGCRSCELACSLTHEGVFAPELARVHIEKIEPAGVDRPLVCRQCGNAACVNACPTGALSRGVATRAVLVDKSICTGCALCASACAFGVIRFSPETGHPLICDLCGGDPQCVKRCSTGALTYGRGSEQRGRGGEPRVRIQE